MLCSPLFCVWIVYILVVVRHHGGAGSTGQEVLQFVPVKGTPAIV